MLGVLTIARALREYGAYNVNTYEGTYELNDTMILRFCFAAGLLSKSTLRDIL